MLRTFNDILDAAAQCGAMKLVVADPVPSDIPPVAAAAQAGLVDPCFVGNAAAIRTLLAETAPGAEWCRIADEREPERILRRAMELLARGDGDILMSGGLGHRAVLDAVNDRTWELVPAGGLVSFVSLFPFVMQNRLILVTDTYLNDRPSLVEKRDILANAIRLARLLGVETPGAAALAAIENVNPAIPSTLDAAILSKMGERGQFGKAVVEGPIDIDCTLSRAAAERKGLVSPVTGEADIYLVPEIDSGYLLAEALVFIGKMRTAGVLMGTARPVVLSAPCLSVEERVVEIAVACLLAGNQHGESCRNL
jgi:phosphotransacetylase